MIINIESKFLINEWFYIILLFYLINENLSWTVVAFDP